MVVSPAQADATIDRTLASYSSNIQGDLAAGTTSAGVTAGTTSATTCYGIPCVSVTEGSQSSSGYLQVKDAQDVSSSMSQGQ